MEAILAVLVYTLFIIISIITLPIAFLIAFIIDITNLIKSNRRDKDEEDLF